MDDHHGTILSRAWRARGIIWYGPLTATSVAAIVVGGVPLWMALFGACVCAYLTVRSIQMVRRGEPAYILFDPSRDERS
jgi:hypothetical protein